MKANYDLPTTCESLHGKIPVAAFDLYDWNADQGYVLNSTGRQLRKLRTALAETGKPPAPPPPSAIPELSLKAWTTLLGVCLPSERPHFLRAASRGEIKVKR